MSLEQEIADLRAAFSHILHHGLPKSETQAREIESGFTPPAKEEEKSSTGSKKA